MQEHSFTLVMKDILSQAFAELADDIFYRSELLQYLNIKTVSASRGSKARGAFGNIYALYVLVEDYKKRGYPERGNYQEAEGARFSDLLGNSRKIMVPK